MIIGIDASLACREKRTGVETYAFYIISHLASVIPPDVDVRLYSDREFPADLVRHFPPHWKQIILTWPPRFLWTQIRLSFEMFRHRPDILFIPGHVEPFIQPKATVMMVHDVAAWRVPDAYSRFDRWYTLFLTMRACRKNPILLTPSIFTKQELEKLSFERKNTHKAQVVVIPHGHVSREQPTDTPQLFIRYGIDTNTRYVLCVGRVEYKKNIDTILSAFERLKKSSPQYTTLKLVLAGKPGVGYEHIAHLINRSPYRADIIETGWLSDTDLAYMLYHARALVFVSRYEGFGFPVLEALDFGVPVVASEGNGLEEIGGEYCTYVPSTNPQLICEALEKLLSYSATERAQFAEGSRRLVSRFSWQHSAHETYDSLIRAYTIAEGGEPMV